MKITTSQQAIVDALIAEFTNINEQASTGNVIDLCEFKARFAADQEKAEAERLMNANILAIKTEMAKQDYEALKKNFEGTGIKVSYLVSYKPQPPYLTITNKHGGQLVHIHYSTGGGNGLHYRDSYVGGGGGSPVKSATLAAHMADKGVREAIYAMYSFNQMNP